jgi:TonB-dependent receptor
VRPSHRPVGPGSTRGSGLRAVLAFALLAMLTLAAMPLAAQGGRIGGRILDAATGRPVAGARVALAGTARAAATGPDGTYLIQAVPAGTHTVTASHLGYSSKTVTDVRVGDAPVTLDITLATSVLSLDELVVTASAERGSVSQALDEQRTSVGVVNSVTSEQIARSPDADAAQAVQRVSGVTVQDGKYVVVRGMGDRYTVTSLNGARIPSPEPERRVVPLDLFPSGIVQSVTTSKTFTPDLPGDFSGALVNIRTREFPTERSFVFSTSIGYNDAVTGRRAAFAPRAGGELFAWTGAGRDLPAPLAQAGDLKGRLNQQQYNTLIGSFRNAWGAQTGRGAPNTSWSASLGGSDPLFGQRIGYLLSGSYARSSEVRAGDYRATYDQTDDEAENIFRGLENTGRTSVLWGGVANLSTVLGTHSRISSNNIYNRSGDNDARTERGFSENYSVEVDIDRLQYVERTVRSNQLAGEHELGSHKLDWAVTSSGVTRHEPDRSEIVYVVSRDEAGNVSGREWLFSGTEAAVRTFGQLDENNLEGRLDYRLGIGGNHSVKVGGLFRSTDREAENRAYSITNRGLPLSREELAQNAEQLFDGRYTEAGDSVFNIQPLLQGGSYTAEDRLAAGYAMAEYRLGRVQVVGGARVEHDALQVNAVSQDGSTVSPNPTYTDVLPSLALNIDVTDAQKLRFSASQTVARPEYRELVPFLIRDVLGADNIQGFPGLRRTRIQNYDARWELYPASDEIISVGVFAKRFDDPIERIYIGTSGAAIISYRNADAATNYGVELELRKNLGAFHERLDDLTFSSNVTVMRSRIDAGDTLSINEDRGLVGQAPYVVNAGLTWAPGEGSTSATLLYNTVGQRVYTAGPRGLPDVLEQPRHLLDLSLRLGLTEGISARFDGRNLLNAGFEVRQGPAVREAYTPGRVFSLGLTWRQ